MRYCSLMLASSKIHQAFAGMISLGTLMKYIVLSFSRAWTAYFQAAGLKLESRSIKRVLPTVALEA